MENFTRTIKSFIVRSGRVTNLQRNALDNYMVLHGIAFDRDKMLDFGDIFKNSNPTVMEIGFGDGTATHQMAERTPGVNYVAMDVYPPGVGALLDIVHSKNLTNVRVLSHDAAEVVETSVADGTVSGFHIFFPDPWQKKRHNKRRLINPAFVATMAQKLKKGGYIYAATDWEDYALQMLTVLRGESTLASPFDAFVTKPNDIVPWRPETKFERKGKESGREIREVYFVKK